MNFFNSVPKAPLGGFFGSAFVIVLCIAATVGIILFVQYILHKAWCGERPANAYEHFEDASHPTQEASNPIQERIDKLQHLQDMVQSDLEQLDDSADATCDITKDIEDNYVSNNSAPTDDSEYELPKDQQDARIKKRQQRAAERFKTEKKRFSALKGVAPLYECFDNPEKHEATEDDLRAAIVEVERLMDTAELKAAATKGQALESLMAFNAGYLKQAAGAITEPFDNPRSGQDLLDYADSLIAKGDRLHNAVGIIVREVKKQQSVAAGIFHKSNSLQNGQISEADSQRAAAKVTKTPS